MSTLHARRVIYYLISSICSYSDTWRAKTNTLITETSQGRYPLGCVQPGTLARPYRRPFPHASTQSPYTAQQTRHSCGNQFASYVTSINQFIYNEKIHDALDQCQSSPNFHPPYSSSSSSLLSSSFLYRKYCINTPASNNSVPKLPNNQLKLTAIYFPYIASASPSRQ